MDKMTVLVRALEVKPAGEGHWSKNQHEKKTKFRLTCATWNIKFKVQVFTISCFEVSLDRFLLLHWILFMGALLLYMNLPVSLFPGIKSNSDICPVQVHVSVASGISKSRGPILTILGAQAKLSMTVFWLHCFQIHFSLKQTEFW